MRDVLVQGWLTQVCVHIIYQKLHTDPCHQTLY